MKRFLVKVVGLGLALAAGTAVATDAVWRSPGQPSAPARVAPGSRSPSMRAAKGDSGPIWLPTQQPAALDTPAGESNDPSADPQPQPLGANEVEPLSAIPVPPGLGPAPPLPTPALGPLRQGPIWGPGAIDTPKSIEPSPKSVDPPPKPVDTPPKSVNPPQTLPPGSPDYLPQLKGDPLPAPRPLDAQPPAPPAVPPAVLPAPRPLDVQPPAVPPAEGALQPAPAELKLPAGVRGLGGKPGTFGAPPRKQEDFNSFPIRLTQDYPPLSAFFHRGHAHDDDETTAPDGPDGTDGTGGPFQRYFVRAEYLLWWMPGFAVPVLATTNSNPALNGFLGEPGTTSLLGPGSLLGSTRSGLRVRAGAWLNDCGTCGIDAGFFFLGRESATINTGLVPLITRPVFAPNLIPGTNTPLGENGEAVAVPGVLSGMVSARATSELWGADVNLRKCLLNTCNARAEWFVGYRFLSLRESLTITEDITVIGPGGNRINVTDPIGTHVVVQDRFATRNYFNGGQIGGLYERRFGRFQVDARASVALGDTHQVLEIDGFQVRQRPGEAPMTFRGGLLAAGPNLGQFSSDRFSVVPEFTLNVGYWVTPRVRLYAGYNFLYWTNVIRPGDQIDHVVDLSFVPNAPAATFSGQFHPRPLFKQTDLAVNGIQFGIDFRW